MIEGVDYSRTPWSGSPSVAALKAYGKKFVGRYAVNDLSPNGRGISAEEYHRMRSGGIEVFLYWESTEGWMHGGFSAGVFAAQNADANIARAGMPLDTPVYFAYDVDPDPSQFENLRLCIEGAASVIGWPRMGFYGGWLGIDHLSPIYDLMKLYCQTSAWEYGRGLHPKATLYQYDYNEYIDGTNCDFVQATKDYYGQAGYQKPLPAPPPTPTFPKPWLPDGWTDWVKDPNATIHVVDGYRFRPVRIKFVTRADTIPRTKPSMTSQYAGKRIEQGTKLLSVFLVDTREHPENYFVQTATGLYLTGKKLSPKVTIEPWA